MFYNGLGGREDADAAMHYFTASINAKGDGKYYAKLSEMYYFREGLLDPSYGQAKVYSFAAIGDNCYDSAHILGMLYENGQGDLPHDIWEAIK